MNLVEPYETVEKCDQRWLPRWLLHHWFAFVIVPVFVVAFSRIVNVEAASKSLVLRSHLQELYLLFVLNTT